MSNWQYRWGDSPLSPTGKFAWLHPYTAVTDEAQNNEWKQLPFPDQPPGRNGQTFVWQRVEIPPGQWKDPAVYIYSVDTIFEAYIDGQRIYRYGRLEPDERQFEGWPFHIISLPSDPSGHYLYLRIYSDYSDIGIYYNVVLDDRADLIEWILLESVDLLVISGSLIVIGLFSFLHFIRTRESFTHLSFSIVCLAEGYRALADSHYPQYIYGNMLLWHYTSWVVLFFFIPSVLVFFYTIYSGKEKVFMGWLVRIQIPISIIYLVYLFFDIEGTMQSVPFRLLAIFYIIAIAFFEARRAIRGNIDARIILIGFSLYGLNATAVMLMDLGILPDLRWNTHWSLFAFVCSLGFVVIRRYGMMREENVRFAVVTRELETARHLHQSLLPADPPEIEGLDLAVLYVSQASLGGDYYDFFRLDRKRVGATIADVSGHGLPAALGVSMAKIAFSEHTSLADRPERFLESTRVSLVDKLQRQFITAGALYIDTDSGIFRYASAGHPPLALLHASGDLEWIRPRGHLIAALPFRGYRMIERPFDPGDRIVMYTDGMSECRNAEGEFYSARRMAETIRRAPKGAEKCAHYIMDDLRKWSREVFFEDDVALIVAERLPCAAEDESGEEH
ncbi:MAG: SpoIIE family protein phosphatase [Leptospiraceae bacterium]|nr:SpoIIE family protein phosphatase [Leptospiraceae bacterium]